MKNERLNILVLHRLDDPRETRHFLYTHVYVLKKYQPEHNYIYHNIHLEFPPYLKDIHFHAIVLDVTFLCIRFLPQELRDSIMDKYAFLSDLDAVKIALPQDDYDHHLVLDQWLCDLNVDVIYTVCPNDWDVLYPRFSQQGSIKLGYTGYIADELIESVTIRDFASRGVDIGYRGRRLPYYFGRIGEIKSTIGEMFLARLSDPDIKCDISNDPKDTIYGDAWLDFIGNCRFVLGSSSGSSLLDPHGDIGRCVKSYCEKNPGAVFEEVEKVCFPGLDNKLEFTALSPRLLEAALMKTGQILVRGEYSGTVKPWEHYIPLEDDASNMEEVVEAVKDPALVSGMIDNCHRDLVQTNRFRYSHRAWELIEEINNRLTQKHINATADEVMRKVVHKHELSSRRAEALFWTLLRVKTRCIRFSREKFPGTYNYMRNIYRSLRY